jgi:hypothetical protein
VSTQRVAGGEVDAADGDIVLSCEVEPVGASVAVGVCVVLVVLDDGQKKRRDFIPMRTDLPAVRYSSAFLRQRSRDLRIS